MNNLLMTKSSDCKSDLVKGHASRPYNSTGKHLLIVLNELFSLGVTAEALPAKIDRKSAISLRRDDFDVKFQVEGVAPSTNHFQRIVRPMNALQLCR